MKAHENVALLRTLERIAVALETMVSLVQEEDQPEPESRFCGEDECMTEHWPGDACTPVHLPSRSAIIDVPLPEETL